MSEDITNKTFVPKLPTQTGGMNCLEYFAGQALIALVGVNDKNPTDIRLQQIARSAVKLSQALIDELDAVENPPE